MTTVEDIDTYGMIYTIIEAFDEFNGVVGGNDVEIEGIYVVGSILTDEFVPQESDMDIYAKVSESYEYDEGFRRLLSDPSDRWIHQLGEYAPEEVSSVDFLGFVTTSAEVRDPSKFISK